MINFSRSYSADEIIRAIMKHDTVSFDIFDTLIKRCVARPRDVFHRVARDFTDKTGIFIDPAKFRDDRHNAEIFAERNTSGREETNLREIYACLPEEYSSFSDELIPLEIQRELKCCRPDPVMSKVYEWCRENHKRIFIISDMYLPIEIIREMLSSCGYEGYEKLYLSSDVGLRKSTGNIFRHFITDSGINPKRHIHIGDAWKGDYLRAIQAGLRAYKITRYPARSKYTKTRGLKPECREQYAKYQTVISNHISPGCDEYYRYGFEVIGMMLYGLCCWLHERFTEKGHDKVFFLARDGYLMREAYNMLFGDKAVNNGYLYISRNSLALPRIWIHPELPDIMESITVLELIDFDRMCHILHIKDTLRAREVWKDCGLDDDTSLRKVDMFSDKRILAFFEAFKDEIIRDSKQSFNTFISYLKQEGFAGSVGIVDIGWICSMQKYMCEFVREAGIQAEMQGYYLGTGTNALISENVESYIPPEEKPNILCAAVMEYPFTKTEGSTKSYAQEKDGHISPVLYDYEFSGLSDEECVKQIQKGILDFISLMRDGYGFEHVEYSVAYARLKKVSKFPSLYDSILLGNLRYVNHGSMSFIAKTRSILHYLAHPSDFKADFVVSAWKTGFLKRLLKLPLPYDKALSILRRIMERKYK